MKYLITSALPYANGPLHIGHLAGAYLSADVYVRFQRLMGEEVVWVCGSDEHGAAITMRAVKEGLTPRQIVDKYDAQFRETFQRIGVSFDIFHRTSAPLHHETSQDFFRKLLEAGQFDVLESEQYFDEQAQQFLADRYIMGTCPKCSNPDAYGDQCEKCGSALSPTELIEPRSVVTGSKPVMKPTKHWYLKLDEHTEWLKTWVNEGTLDGAVHHNPADWKAHVVGQCNSWLNDGLKPRAMTRDLDWGVDVPQELEGSKGKKLYVWLDAPIGYISATKQWAADNGKDWRDYWCNPDTQLIHFIGKDNIVFHCVIFPAILRAHGGFNLPVNVPANQFMNLEGDKISTSRNWAVWVHEYLDELPGKEDVLRYNMIKNMPELRDSEFTWKGWQESNNNELVNNLANFVHRVLVLTHKYYGGEVPEPKLGVGFLSSTFYQGFLEGKDFVGVQNHVTQDTYEIDVEGDVRCLTLQHLGDKLYNINQSIKSFNFRTALQGVMEISTLGNQLLQANEPWKLYKTEPERTANVLFTAIQYVAALSVAMWPFLPFTSDKLREMIGLEKLRKPDLDNHEQGEWSRVEVVLSNRKPIIASGHRIGEAEHLFTRITDEVVEAQTAKLVKPATAPAVEAVEQNYKPMQDTIVMDDFAKIDLRTGTITAAERVPKADKLLKLSVDLGFEQRTILSGIALHFAPEDIVGQQVVVVANLAPRTMRGIESQGMILMAENADGKLMFVQPRDTWGNGWQVK